MKASLKANGSDHRDGLDYFTKSKFDLKNVVSTVREIIGAQDYGKILVILESRKGEERAVEEETRRIGIEIWYMRDLIHALSKLTLKGSRDDILRVIELFSLA